MTQEIDISTSEKVEFLLKVFQVWDTLTERQKGRLEGQLDVYENLEFEKGVVN